MSRPERGYYRLIKSTTRAVLAGWDAPSMDGLRRQLEATQVAWDVDARTAVELARSRATPVGAQVLAAPADGAYFAAITVISTSSSGRAMRASRQARAGWWPGTTQASQISFIRAKWPMLFR